MKLLKHHYQLLVLASCLCAVLCGGAVAGYAQQPADAPAAAASPLSALLPTPTPTPAPTPNPVLPDPGAAPEKTPLSLQLPSILPTPQDVGKTAGGETGGGALPVGPAANKDADQNWNTAEIKTRAPLKGGYGDNVGGINLPSPPPASALSTDPAQLAAQAEQAAARAQAADDMARRRQEYIDKSFNKAVNGILPMSPDQVRQFMHRLEQEQEASLAPFAGQPKGQVRVATLSLDPGTEPPVLNLSSGYVTTVNLMDATGEPWPILDVGVGGNYEVSPTTAGSHVVRIMPLTRVGSGNLSVLLKDLPTPVIFKLSSGGPDVDLRYDARIGKIGPGAKPPLIERPRLEAGNQTLMLLLANAPPASAKRLKVAGLDARTMAWSLEGRVYVRTPLTLLSPAWDASVASGDGMMVYEIANAPVLLMSDSGAMVRARLVQEDDHDR